MVLTLLARSGVNFDCASMQEIKKVLSLGVDPSRIVYAHPVKTIKYLQYARLSGVSKMTFDSLDELYKVREPFCSFRSQKRGTPDRRKMLLRNFVALSEDEIHLEAMISLFKA